MYVFVAECKASDPWYGFNLMGVGATLEAAQALCQNRYDDVLIWAEGTYRNWSLAGGKAVRTELPCWYGESEPDENGFAYFSNNDLRIRVMEVAE